MLVHTVEGRNEAWHRENIARARTHELEFYIEDLEEHNTYLHEEVHRLSNLLNPNHEPQADAMDPMSSLPMMMNQKKRKKKILKN